MNRLLFSIVIGMVCFFNVSCTSMQPKIEIENTRFLSDMPKLNIQFKHSTAKYIDVVKKNRVATYMYFMKNKWPLYISIHNMGYISNLDYYYADNQSLLNMGFHPLGETVFGGKKWTIAGKLLPDDNDKFYFGYYKRKDNKLILIWCVIHIHNDNERQLIETFRHNVSVTPLISKKVENIQETLSDLFVIVE